tara:strand:+ start:1203 stop:1613 length:411 start_codon:yes stop_codon:yes gene_type:complete
MSNINLWLEDNTSKYSDLTNREYIKSIFSILYDWLETNNKLYLNFTPQETLTYFYIFIYNKHSFTNESCDIIDIYFTSDIVDIYFDISEKYGTTLLEKQSISSDDLLIFLNYATYFYEEDNMYEEEEIMFPDEIIM